MSDNTHFYVGVGASAGGLEALSSLFSMMPSNTGATFIVVQHLSPDFKSLMDELLRKYTKMTIKIAENDMVTQPDTIYLIPPRTNLSIINGHLYLEEYKDTKALHLPIDIFFDSLAIDQKDKAIAIVLSGTGSDGSRGIKRINEQGGLVLAQSIESSKFDGMPRNAISTGICDFIMRPEEMPNELVNYMNQPALVPGFDKVEQSFEMQQLKRIGIIMNVHSGIDFNMYKSSTILRRIERRIKVNKMTMIDEYIQFLLSSDKEKEILKKDFLIGVTGFFRDNGAYDALSQKAFSYLDMTQGEIRVWIAGCSTGEEAYSIAIRLQEYIDESGSDCSFKLFATDINAEAIELANVGYYTSAVMETIPDDIVDKYFEPDRGGYRIMDSIRKRIVYAKHNLLLDPPFSKLDLLVCRNVLIYIKPEYQENIFRHFYRSLNKNGILFLGSSESLGAISGAFHTIDKKWNIFRKNISAARRMMEGAKYNINYRYREPDLHDTVGTRTARTSNESVLTHMVGAVIESGMLIDNNDKIIQVINDCTDYMQAQPGKFTTTINSNIKKEFILLVNNIIRRLKNKEKVVKYTNIRAEHQDFVVSLDGYLINTKDEPYYLISFHKEKLTKAQQPTLQEIDYSKEKNDRIDFLEHELMQARENLQATVEELETSNEELQSSNEELIASNEELQSTNEELQSVNEELFSVNNEYQSKIEALTELNNDLNNLLVNTEVGAIYLDKELRIRKITPLITEITNLVDDDIDRPFEHLSVMNAYPDISKDVASVRETLKGIDKDVKDEHGRTWFTKIKPYRREQNIVEGVIITFVEISDFIDERTKTHVTSKILDVVLKTAEMGWFRYDLNNDEYSVSYEFYKSIGFANKDIPSTLDGFYQFVNEQDISLVRRQYHKLISGKAKQFDIHFTMSLPNKEDLSIRQTAERVDDSIIGTTLVVTPVKDLTK